MNSDDPIQEREGAPAAPVRRNRARTVAVALALLLAVAGGLAWYAQDRRVARDEQALAAATAERDAAVAAAAERQALLDRAEAEGADLEARRLELEGQLRAAREELARLQATVANGDAAAEPHQEPTTAQAEAGGPPAAIAGTPEPATEEATADGPTPPSPAVGESATAEQGVEALEEQLALDPAAAPAGAASGPPAVERQPSSAAATPSAPASGVAEAAPAAGPEPAAGPAAGANDAESLTVTFEVNSSYLPASLDGRLRRLASRLERGQAYEVELVGSVGAGAVANASQTEAARYNRWLAERRVDRVAEFLQENADAGALTIEREFAANDPSRRVVVRVRPVP